MRKSPLLSHKLVEAGKKWAEAETYALAGGGTFGGLGTALEAGTAARTLMTEQILSIPKGARPDPTTYLPQSFIDAGLSTVNQTTFLRAFWRN